jgi:tripartite-type tricarboxylate transporter receptor subunit TctC
MKFTRSLMMGLLALALPFAHSASAAGKYPDHAIRMIVPFSAGGIVDSLARIVAEPLSKRLGQAVIVENKAGAGGAIGTEFVARSAPDGYTLLVVSPGHAVQPLLNKSARWNPTRDFRGIAEAGIVPNIIVVPSTSPIKTLPELIAQAKAKPGEVTYGTAGIGTSNHLSGELLAQMAGIKLVQVPYKGQPEALNDLLTGRLSMMPLTTALAVPHIRDGKLRPLAVTTRAKSSTLPKLPTVATAANLPDYDVGTWFGFVAPAKIPDAVQQQLSKDIVAILKTPEVVKRLQGLGMEMDPQDGHQFDQYVAAEYKKWSDVLNKAGLAVH